MKIITHPDNLELVKRLCDEMSEPLHSWCAIQIVTNCCMAREKWTGRYILPDGRSVDPKDVHVPEGRFFEWTESDIPSLLLWGLIRKEMEPLFYQINDSMLKFPLMDFMTVQAPKYLITAAM